MELELDWGALGALSNLAVQEGGIWLWGGVSFDAELNCGRRETFVAAAFSFYLVFEGSFKDFGRSCDSFGAALVGASSFGGVVWGIVGLWFSLPFSLLWNLWLGEHLRDQLHTDRVLVGHFTWHLGPGCWTFQFLRGTNFVGFSPWWCACGGGVLVGPWPRLLGSTIHWWRAFAGIQLVVAVTGLANSFLWIAVCGSAGDVVAGNLTLGQPEGAVELDVKMQEELEQTATGSMDVEQFDAEYTDPSAAVGTPEGVGKDDKARKIANRTPETEGKKNGDKIGKKRRKQLQFTASTPLTSGGEAPCEPAGNPSPASPTRKLKASAGDRGEGGAPAAPAGKVDKKKSREVGSSSTLGQ
ncbi:unnamed protein product [Calypogeia fissa]